MRKLILETQISIDGFIADGDGKTDWMIWNWGSDWTWDKLLQQYHTDLTKSVDCILLSRQMAEEGFKDHWKRACENPNDPRYEFAKHVTETYKVVFSTTMKKSTPIPGGWDNTEIATGDYIEFINHLKDQDGKDIIVYGGATLVSSLIKADLIDEFHLIVNPTTVGGGLSIFNGGGRRHMKLMNALSFDCGVAVLIYALVK